MTFLCIYLALAFGISALVAFVADFLAWRDEQRERWAERERQRRRWPT